MANVFRIHCEMEGGRAMESVVTEMQGKSTADIKKMVGECVAENLKPIREKIADLRNNEDYLEKLLRENSNEANDIAQATLHRVRNAFGLI